jgi:hypothetical protein
MEGIGTMIGNGLQSAGYLLPKVLEDCVNESSSFTGVSGSFHNQPPVFVICLFLSFFSSG